MILIFLLAGIVRRLILIPSKFVPLQEERISMYDLQTMGHGLTTL